MQEIMQNARDKQPTDLADLEAQANWPQTEPGEIDQPLQELQAVAEGEIFNLNGHTIHQGDSEVEISQTRQVRVGVVYDSGDNTISYLSAQELKNTHQEAPTIPLIELEEKYQGQIVQGKSLSSVRKKGSSVKRTPVGSKPKLRKKQ